MAKRPAKGIFQDPKKALILVGGTMLAALLLVGSEDQEGALVLAASTVEDGAVATAQEEVHADNTPKQQSAPADEQPSPSDWADDDELIDDTAGLDPTPGEFDPADGDEYFLEDEY